MRYSIHTRMLIQGYMTAVATIIPSSHRIPRADLNNFARVYVYLRSNFEYKKGDSKILRGTDVQYLLPTNSRKDKQQTHKAIQHLHHSSNAINLIASIKKFLIAVGS